MKKYNYTTIIISIMVYTMLNISCQKLDPVAVTKFCPPENVSSINYNSAIVKGEFMDIGDEVTSYGHCWSTASNPTTAHFKTVFSGKPHKQVEFTSELKGLTGGTKYYVRIYATSASGTIYGEEFNITTDPATVTDVDGNTYNFIDIGTQTWMRENLKTTKYNDGKAIFYPGTDNEAWINNTIGAYAWYNNDVATHKAIYGGLYNWYAVNTGKLCPAGWHVPTDAEWIKLINYLGGLAVAGGKLKETGTMHWAEPNNGATNETGFTALPGGVRGGDGLFYVIGQYGNWLTTTQFSAYQVRTIAIGYPDSRIFRDSIVAKIDGKSVRCIMGTSTQINLPNVSTNAVNPITQISATSGGNITSNGGAAITARGVCWSTTSGPTIALVTKTNDGPGDGPFSSSITGLTPNTTYYVRAYATNSAGTAYGNEISFTTAPLTLTDLDGNVYDAITIGTQVWMAENLKTTKYRDNTAIAYPGTDNTEWTNNTTGAYAWYNNDIANKAAYGALYNWHAVNTSKLCPAGWHVPTDAEWTTLENYLIANGYNYDGTTTGNKIAKSLAAPNFWTTSTIVGTPGNTDYPAYRNKSGFTGIPGGYRFGSDGVFSNVGGYSYWWSSNADGASTAWYRNINYNNANSYRNSVNNQAGFSIRCFRD